MIENGGIKLACTSLMWGKFDLPADEAAHLLDDIAEAGYEGVGLFHTELIRFMKELDIPSLLRERNLSLASVNYPVQQFQFCTMVEFNCATPMKLRN